MQIFQGHNNDQGAMNRTIWDHNGSDLSMLSWLEGLPDDVKILGDGGYFGTAHPGLATPSMNPYLDNDTMATEWAEKLGSKRVIVENFFARTSFWQLTFHQARMGLYRHAVSATCIFMLVDEDLVEHPLRRDCRELDFFAQH